MPCTINQTMTPKKSFLLVFALLITAVGAFAQQANEESVKNIEKIVGRWELAKTYAGSREITSNPNSETRSWIQFDRDGTYQLQRDGNDTGSYRLNENHSTLYLESGQAVDGSAAATANGRITEYSISLNGDVLTMQQKSDAGSTNKYVYNRVGEGSGEEN